MTPQRHQTIKRIFLAACDQPPEDRAQFVARECGGDDELRSAVLRQLQSDARTMNALDGSGMRAELETLLDHQAQVPESIGGYRILRRIAEGGMGSVFEAEQDAPRRRVALKVIRPDLASPTALRRFEFEARVLGHLEHPGIARIYEAGLAHADPPGRSQPFFAMELIDGLTLVQYADKVGAGLRARLQLLVAVCDAVQHAHQKGILHRDLKPANILVDNSGQPRVLDFGVARATDVDLQTMTMPSEDGKLIGTLAYMSPEQVHGDVDAMDVRTDVYSLGVILYELLGGQLPHPVSGLSLPDAARIIVEHEPLPLGRLNRAFRGDIETITATAMARDKALRYQSGSDLAADLRRYLRDEAVLARKPSATYRAVKFIRRNRVLVASATFVFLALSTAAVVSSLQSSRAWHAEARARAETERLQTVNDFLREVLVSVGEQRHDVTVRAMLDLAVIRLDSGMLAEQPELEQAIRATLGSSYKAIGSLDEAATQMRRALALAAEMRDEYDPLHVAAMHQLGLVLADRNDYAAAEPLLTRALDLAGTTFAGQPELGAFHLALGELLLATGRYQQAEEMNLAALQILRSEAEPGPAELLAVLNNLGVATNYQGRPTESQAYHREALDVCIALHGHEHRRTAQLKAGLGRILVTLEEYEEAEQLMRAALATDLELRGGDDPVLIYHRNYLATLLADTDRGEEAEALFREALSLVERTLGSQHSTYAWTLNNLGRHLNLMDRPEEAEPLLSKAVQAYRRIFGPQHPNVAVALMNLGRALDALQLPADAERRFREALTINQQALGPDHRGTRTCHYLVSRAELSQGQAEQALASIDQALRGAPSDTGLQPVALARLHLQRGEVLIALDRADEAQPLLESAYDTFAAGNAAARRHAGTAAETLAGLAEERGDDALAETWQARAAALAD